MRRAAEAELPMSGDMDRVSGGTVCAGQLRKLELTLEKGTEQEASAVNLDNLVTHLQPVRERDGRRRRLHRQIHGAVKEVSHVLGTGSEEEAERECRQCAADSEAAAAGAAACMLGRAAAAAATPVEEQVLGTKNQEEEEGQCAPRS